MSSTEENEKPNTESVQETKKVRKRDTKASKKSREDSLAKKVDPKEKAKPLEDIGDIAASIRSFYNLDIQKVTMKVFLKNPEGNKSVDNRTLIIGQTILCFNRIESIPDPIDRIRDLRLDLHCANMTIKKIGLARRYKKRDQNKKVVETLHERIKDLKGRESIENLDEWKNKNMWNPKFSQSEEEKENLDN